ncbi:MAG: hypothetical protein AAF926_03115 [Pseudomonadota bacterium]
MTVDILRWLHILAMVYWLGGEWGVFQTSYKVCNPALSYDERMRHMDTAYRIDVMARTGIIALLPLGLHMGYLWGMHDYGGAWLVGMWVVFAAWFALTWTAFAKRKTPISDTLYKIEDWTRYLLIPTLLVVSTTSFMGMGPFVVGEGQNWYTAKVLVYALALCIGVVLRWVMSEWHTHFRTLADGPNEAVEASLARSIAIGRGVAYFYWILIAGTAFLGAVKPF